MIVQNSKRHNSKTAEVALREVCRTLHLSIHTENSYAGWLMRFSAFAKDHVEVAREEKVRWFLSDLAPRVSVSTHRQALCAIVFFYKRVLNEPLGIIGEIAPASVPKRLPDCMTDSEVRAVLGKLRGEFHDMAALAYGAGLRLRELVSLRVKDLDFERGTIIVRQGKGAKDRATFLPRSCADELRAQLRESRLVWERDRQRGLPGVFLPDSLESKMPNAGSEWAWQWVWPSRELSTDPRTGIRRRHHIHETAFQKAVKAAGMAAGLSRRVHPHLFRHSFATACLTQGMAIHELKELLGHVSIETTEQYLHVLGPALGRTQSPLDAQPSNVVRFADQSSHNPVLRIAEA